MFLFLVFLFLLFLFWVLLFLFHNKVKNGGKHNERLEGACAEGGGLQDVDFELNSESPAAPVAELCAF